jgi:type IV secretory pathway TrbL component
MLIIPILIMLVVVGVLLWAVSLIPMDATIHLILRAVVVIAVIVWLLQQFGVLRYLHLR